jgi:accessory gene regulator B
MVKLFDKLADQLIANNTINQEDKELYTYGLQQGSLIIINILTTILIGLMFQMVWQSVLFMLAYIPLRSYAGGYHASTQLKCYLLSILLNVLVLLTIKFIPWTNFIILGITLLAATIILLLAPVEDSNKPLDDMEVKVYKNRTRILLICEIIVLMFVIVLDFKQIASCIVLSLLVLSVMLVLGKIKLSAE